MVRNQKDPIPLWNTAAERFLCFTIGQTFPRASFSKATLVVWHHSLQQAHSEMVQPKPNYTSRTIAKILGSVAPEVGETEQL